ncbi:MAG TPA: M56 family metallopeptidase [Gemmataceae bacterium]
MDDLLNIALSNAVVAAVLALVAAAAGALCRRPALVHGLWLLVLLKLVTPPLLRIPVAWPTALESVQAPVAASAMEAPISETTSSSPEQPDVVLVLPMTAEGEPASSADAITTPPAPVPVDPPLWSRVMPLVWLAGSLGWFALALLRLGRFRRLLRFAHGAPASLQERAARLARRLGLPRCPQVGLLPGRLAPMLWAVGGSPRLLVPADLLDLLDDKQLDTLLVHELAHLRRRDHWVRALEFVVMGLYWWHPVVWYARRELREAEEQCCDAWVVSTLPGASRTYATALMDTLDFLSTARPAVPPLASGIGHVADLKRRLTMIMRGTTPRALSWPGCLTVLAVGAFFLPLLPALQAQEPSKEDVKKQLLDELNAQSKLDSARGDIEKLEAMLKAKMAEVEAAKAALQAAAKDLQSHQQKLDALKHAQAKIYYQGRLITPPGRDSKGSDLKEKQVRIEIVLNAEGVNVKELAKKIESVLPKNARVRIESLAAGVDPGKLKGVAPLQYYEKGAAAGPYNMLYKVLPGPQPPVAIPAPPPPPSQDKRINELEKKLEKVLHELHEMRKQMKEPRSGLTPADDNTVFPRVRLGADSGLNPSPPPVAPKQP